MTTINKYEKVKSFLDNSFYDVQGIPGLPIDQSYVIKVLTKMLVGASTAVWSFIELKDYLQLSKKYKDMKKWIMIL